MSFPIEGPIEAARGLRAVSAGALALRLLGAGAHGSVIAKFEHSMYARFGSDVFVCIGAEAIGEGPLNVLLERADWLQLSAVPLAQRVDVRDGVLDFGRRFQVALARATRWTPRRIAAMRDLPQRLGTLLPIARRMAPAMGLSRLAFAPAAADPDPLLSCARPAWDALECWLAAGDPPSARSDSPASVTSRLIGLGPGLTPSGDDVFCGVLIALRLLERNRKAAALLSWLLPQLEQRTSALSAAHVRGAATGQGHAALHAVLEGMAGEAPARWEETLRALGEVGHCSGWDGLAGVVLVCRHHPE